MSVIFFYADFSTFSYLKLASDTFGGIHKQYGPKRGRGRLFYLIYVITWFIVACPFWISQVDQIPTPTYWLEFSKRWNDVGNLTLLNMQYFEKGHLSFRWSKNFFFVFHGG